MTLIERLWSHASSLNALRKGVPAANADTLTNVSPESTAKIIAEAADRITELETMLERVIRLANAYSSGTGTLFDEAMAEAQSLLEKGR